MNEHPTPRGAMSPGPRPPSARSAVAPFIAMDVLSEARDLARAGRDIVHLEVGEPGAPTPARIREAAARALAQDRIAYTEALGMPRLREAIARHYRERYGLTVDPARVIVTTGSSGGFILAFLALFDAGARIGIPRPGYPAYRNIMAALGLEPVDIAADAASRHALGAQGLTTALGAGRLDGVLVMSPANPTGVTTGPAALADIVAAATGAGLWLVSDEIYHGLDYEGETASALAFSDECIVVNSFSKYFCMTGWRVGWLVVPARLTRVFERLQQNLSISVPYLSQIAALAAFEAREDLEAIKDGYRRNRAMLAEALPRLGLPALPMDGAFYAYVDISRHANDSRDFARRALHEAGVAATPGVDFDPVDGTRGLRFSYAGSEADIREAIRRLTAWLGR